MKYMRYLVFTIMAVVLFAPAVSDAKIGTVPSPGWVAALPAAEKTDQLVVVGGVGKTTAWVSMHQKNKDHSFC